MGTAIIIGILAIIVVIAVISSVKHMKGEGGCCGGGGDTVSSARPLWSKQKSMYSRINCSSSSPNATSSVP